jgi:hypothetical protein
VPTPEDFPQARRPGPETRLSQLKYLPTRLDRPFSPKAETTCPLLVLILQLTYRVVKILPSDALFLAKLVPNLKTAFLGRK